MSGLIKKLLGGKRPTREERIAAFWHWFRGHAYLLRADEGPEREAALEDLQIELDRASRGLTFELGGEAEGQDVLFAVSADGRRELFADVEALVAAAPEVPGFAIVAFRQKKDVAYDVELGDIHFRPAEVLFRLDGGALTLYLPDLTAETKPGLTGAAHLALEDALGERDAALRIRSLELRATPADRGGLRPFAELADAVDHQPR